MATKSRSSKSAGAATPTEAIAAGTDFMRDQMEKAMGGYGAFATISKDAMDAWVQSATAARKGFETINTEVMTLSRQSVEEAVTTMKSTLTVKSVEEYYSLQNEFARNTLDGYVSRSARIGEVMADTMREVWEPLQGQMNNVFSAAQQNVRAAA